MTIKEFAQKLIQTFEEKEMEAYREKQGARDSERDKLNAVEQTWSSAKWMVHDLLGSLPGGLGTGEVGK